MIDTKARKLLLELISLLLRPRPEPILNGEERGRLLEQTKKMDVFYDPSHYL